MPNKVRETATTVYKAACRLTAKERDELLKRLEEDRIADTWSHIKELKLTPEQERRLDERLARDDAEGRTKVFETTEALLEHLSSLRKSRTRQ